MTYYLGLHILCFSGEKIGEQQITNNYVMMTMMAVMIEIIKIIFFSHGKSDPVELIVTTQQEPLNLVKVIPIVIVIIIITMIIIGIIIITMILIVIISDGRDKNGWNRGPRGWIRGTRLFAGN